jgi:hypothetical protein
MLVARALIDKVTLRTDSIVGRDGTNTLSHFDSNHEKHGSEQTILLGLSNAVCTLNHLFGHDRRAFSNHMK